jgi:hypothetical protein
MVSNLSLATWLEAFIAAIVIPTALYNLAPLGWLFAIFWLAAATWLYSTAFSRRPAGAPFALLTMIVVFLVVPALLAQDLTNQTIDWLVSEGTLSR